MATKVNRRYFFFGALGATLACTKAVVHPATIHRVSIIKALSYNHDLTDIIRRILIDHQVPVENKRILLKPNLVEFSPYAPIHTNPILVTSVLEAVTSLGAQNVIIAEGPGHRRITLDMAQAAGFFAAIPRFEDRFVDLNIDDVRRVTLSNPVSRLKELYLPETVFDCDLIVSLPKMKTHHWAGATLSMKNLFGMVPGSVYGWPKNILHWSGIDECVVDIQRLFPHQFAIVDGIEAMEGNGPILGKSKHLGLIVAGSHPPSVDATCCRIMGIDPTKIRYLSLIKDTAGGDWSSIQDTGENVATVRSPFALHHDLEHLRG